jgi:hypothetical protein
MEPQSSFLPPYVSTRSIVRYLTILLLFTAGLSSVSAGFEIAEIRLLAGIRNSESLSEPTRWAYSMIRNTLLIARVILVSTIAMTFIAWLHRARVNARSFGCRRFRFARHWTVIGFAIPIANLFRPLQVVSEVWQASDPRAIQTSVEWKSVPVPRLLPAWWGVLLASATLELVSAALLVSAGVTVERLSAARGIAAAAHLASVAAAILAYLVVSGIGRAQEAKWATLNSAGLTPGVVYMADEPALPQREAVAANSV